MGFMVFMVFMALRKSWKPLEPKVNVGDSLGSSSCQCHPVAKAESIKFHLPEATETRLELSVLSWGYPQNPQSSSIN